MLALLSAASGAPPRALVPDSGNVCISTAVHMKTAQCNLDCNAPQHECPRRECFCAPAKASLELSFGMPSDSFASLVQAAHANDDTNDSFVPAAAALRRKWADTTTTPAKAKLPKDMVGSYLKTWACKDRSAPACKGPPEQNINVIFSGYSALAKALPAALNEEQTATCTDSDQKWCDAQVDFMVTTTKVAKDRDEAIKMALEPNSFLEPKCKPCYAPKPEKNDTSTRPFSRASGLYQGVQFLSVGGANRNGLINAQRLEDYSTSEGLNQIKAAGFEGVCFDVESTEGEDDLVAALERAFAACKRAGLLVMVTTSHTAPYAAASDASKPMMVDSWVKSNDIDIFSPQLYTSGREGSPEYDETPCASGCSYDRLKKMKAKWVPSVANPSHYPAVRDFLAGMGIQSHGFLQWQAKSGKP